MTRLCLGLAAGLALVGCNVINGDLLGGSDAGPGSDGTTDGMTDPPVKYPTAMLLTNYEFEDGTGTMVTDLSRALPATLSDASMWTAMGRNGKAIMFNGATPATQYVTLPSGMLAGVDDFTIGVWVKMSGNPAWARIYDIGNGLPDPQNRFMYLTTSGFTEGVPDGLHASSYGGSTSNESIISTSTSLPLNVWKHVTITGSGGQRKLFIDGFPAATLDSGPAIAPREVEPIAPNSWIGRSRFATDAGFPGTMDEFRVYGRVLTAAEISELAWPKQDYSYWRFDESSGAAAKDSSDRAIPTALANGAGWTTGRLGGAADFGGGAAGSAGPHAVLSGNPLKGCTNQMTISMWVRVRSLVSNARIFDFGAGTTHSLYLAATNGTGMHVGMKSPGGTFDMVTTTPPVTADSTWHHVALTMDSGNVVVLFVDGMPVKTQSGAGVRVADFANLDEALLAKSRGNQPYYDGGIDELRVGCRALTPDEIKNLSHP